MVNTNYSSKIDKKSMKVEKKKTDRKKEVQIDKVKLDDKKDFKKKRKVKNIDDEMKVERKRRRNKYSIGSKLVSFMCDREVIKVDCFDNLSNKAVPAKRVIRST